MDKTDRNRLKDFRKYYLKVIARVRPNLQQTQLGIMQNNLQLTLEENVANGFNTRNMELRIQAIKQLRTELLINATT